MNTETADNTSMRNTIYYLRRRGQNHRCRRGWAPVYRFVVLSHDDKVTIQPHRIVGDKMEPLGIVIGHGRQTATWWWNDLVRQGWHRWIPR